MVGQTKAVTVRRCLTELCSSAVGQMNFFEGFFTADLFGVKGCYDMLRRCGSAHTPSNMKGVGVLLLAT